MNGASSSDPRAARFLRACRREPVDRTPIWLMRQAGRFMPEYRALRQRHGMLDLVRTPELAAQITLQPVDAFEIDAAIVFADILPILDGMGLVKLARAGVAAAWISGRPSESTGGAPQPEPVATNNPTLHATRKACVWQSFMTILRVSDPM